MLRPHIWIHQCFMWDWWCVYTGFYHDKNGHSWLVSLLCPLCYEWCPGVCGRSYAELGDSCVNGVESLWGFCRYSGVILCWWPPSQLVKLAFRLALSLRGRVLRSPWRAHSHFEGLLWSRIVDEGWERGWECCDECVMMLWRGYGGVVECVWECGLFDMVNGCGCEYQMGLDVLYFGL